ncbi:TonB-dependent receptor plug domain-containing protein [Acetobacter papayae]|nr:TonB-dependent receptor plug domain-containing protein [Acetobacter papayae]
MTRRLTSVPCAMLLVLEGGLHVTAAHAKTQPDTVPPQAQGPVHGKAEAGVKPHGASPAPAAQGKPATEHEDITVAGLRSGFLPHASQSATKTQTPLELTPQNITVITQERMKILNARSVSEAIRYSAGVSDYGSKDDPRGYFGTIRGFSPDIYLDGTRTPDASSSQSFSIEPWG